MGNGDILTMDDLPSSVTSPERDIVEEAVLDNVPLAEVERRYIVKILEKMGGHQIKSAQILGIDRRTLYRRLRQYGYGGQLHDEDSDLLDSVESNVQVRASSL